MITGSITDNGMMQRLSALQSRLDIIPRNIWDDIGTILIRSIQQNFEAGGRPSAWVPSKKKEGKTLIKTGKLKNSVRIGSQGDTFIEVVMPPQSELPYVNIHQFGGTIHAKNVPYLKFQIDGQWYSKKSVTIPARRYFRIQDEDAKRITELLGNYIMKGTR